MSPALDNRPRCHYAVDVRGTEGQIVGPTLYGEFLVVDEVAYDGTGSTVWFRNATVADITPKQATGS